MASMARALNVAHSLEVTLDRSKRIAIVGGGITGATIAYCLIKAGFDSVVVFEERGELLPNFGTASHRYIHPFLFDWPASDWGHSSFGYAVEKFDIDSPNLIWDAHSATVVRDQLLTEILQLGISPNSTRIVDCDEKPNYVRVIGEKVNQGDFEIVCICPGLGKERGLPDSSYWVPHEVHDQNLAIVGNGDGAIIDAMRFLIAEPSEEDFYLNILREWEETSLSELRPGDLPEIRKCESMVGEFFTMFPTRGRDISQLSTFVAKSCPILCSVMESRLKRGRTVTVFHLEPSFYRLTMNYVPIAPLNFVLFEALRAIAPGSVQLKMGRWKGSRGGIETLSCNYAGGPVVSNGMIDCPGLLVRVGVDRQAVLLASRVKPIDDHPDDVAIYSSPKKF